MGYFDKPWWSPQPWDYSGQQPPPGSGYPNGTPGDGEQNTWPNGGGERPGGPKQRDPLGGVAGGVGAPPITGIAPPDSVLPGPAGVPVDTGGGGGGYGGGGGGDAAGPYVSPLGPAPTFNAPQFKAPTGADVLNDPGYQFRLNQGTGALQASAAAKGVLRSGQTLGDIVKYGSDYASNEYGNAYNRALQSYGTQYQGAKDEYAPRLADWNRQWDIYQFTNPTWGEAHRPPQQPIIPDFPDFVPPQ